MTQQQVPPGLQQIRQCWAPDGLGHASESVIVIREAGEWHEDGQEGKARAKRAREFYTLGYRFVGERGPVCRYEDMLIHATSNRKAPAAAFRLHRT